jgi:hypothetical protein
MTHSTPTHASEVADLWDAYARKENTRVPITFAIDDQVWVREAGCSYRDLYTDPRTHLRAQLAGKRWLATQVVGDMATGIPDRWDVGTQIWMEENEFFGCQVIYQEDDYAWSHPLPYDSDDLLRHIADIDPETRVRESSAFRMYKNLKELADGMEFEGRPVDIHPCGGTHGVFTKAAEIRRIEALCMDIVESPEFVARLLDLVFEKTFGRMRAWHKLATGMEPEWPTLDGYGCCDDSLQIISPRTYEGLVLPVHERLYATMTTGSRSIHLCGHAQQHYENLVRKLGITCIDGPGPFADHAHWLERLGPDLRINAQMDHSVLINGSPNDIDRMMADLLTPGAKLPGRFNIMGMICRDTPIENVRLAYEAGRRYGRMKAEG